MRAWKKVFEQDLDSIAVELRECLKTPAMVILTGELGSGKTTLVKRLVSSLGAQYASSGITSPTYSLVHEMGKVVHADLYRLKDAQELVHLELPLYLEDRQYFLVEWGRPWLTQLKRLIGEEYTCYELELVLNHRGTSVGNLEQPSEQESAFEVSRNYFLRELS